MNLKQYVRYHMDFKGKWAQTSAVLMGISFFLRIVYYTALINLSDCGIGEVIISLILPLLLCGGYIILLWAMKFNAPGVYGILGASMCILLILWSFSTGSILRILLCLIIYSAAGVVLLATVGGYLPGKLLSSSLFAVSLICRIIFYSFGSQGFDEWFLEASSLCMVASLFSMTRSLKASKHRPSAEISI